MLFDLRGRGRRRTVQAVYLGLALLIGGGLVLFGVGTGTGGGGLLNGIGGSGGSQGQAVSSQEKAALHAVKVNPNNPSAWSQLVQARWTTASSTDYNQTTGTFTAAGIRELTLLGQAWQKYLGLTKSPDPNTAILAARAYAKLGNYSGEAGAWQAMTQASPTDGTAFACLAASAYAAKDNRLGDLAITKALALTPKAQRAVLKNEITAAKTQPTVAQSC